MGSPDSSSKVSWKLGDRCNCDPCKDFGMQCHNETWHDEKFTEEKFDSRWCQDQHCEQKCGAHVILALSHANEVADLSSSNGNKNGNMAEDNVEMINENLENVTTTTRSRHYEMTIVASIASCAVSSNEVLSDSILSFFDRALDRVRNGQSI